MARVGSGPGRERPGSGAGAAALGAGAFTGDNMKISSKFYVIYVPIAQTSGFNTKAKLTTRKAFGFRTYKVHRIALLHQLGDLPTPDFLPKLC